MMHNPSGVAGPAPRCGPFCRSLAQQDGHRVAAAFGEVRPHVQGLQRLPLNDATVTNQMVISG